MPEAELFLGGDTMLGRGVAENIRATTARAPLDPIASMTRAADGFLVNLECALTARETTFTREPKTFLFRAPPEAVEVLTHAGVDAVSLANNHTLDADTEGLYDTIEILDEHGIAHAGAGPDLVAARAPAILDAGPLRVALLSACDHQASFAATANRPGIWHFDYDAPETITPLLDATAACADAADHVVVALHWQPNWVPAVEPRTRRLAERLAEAGATVVWGHSPHHFQGVAYHEDSVICYATGDLLDDYAVDDYYRNDRQLLFAVTLTERGAASVRARPLQLDYACTRPAEGEAWTWTAKRFADCCEALGTAVERAGDWLRVV